MTGTLGVLDLAARRGLIDFAQAIEGLRRTTFRVPEELLDSLLKKHAEGGEGVWEGIRWDLFFRRQFAAGLPLRAGIGVGDGFGEAAEKVVEFRSRLGIPGLIHVVRRAVIAVGVPAPVDYFLRRAFLIAEDKSGGGNAALDEIKMIGAAHQVAIGLGIGLDADTHGFGYGASRVAERGIVQREHGEQFQREQRAKLIEIDVGHHALFGHGGVGDEIARAQKTFLFSGEDGE